MMRQPITTLFKILTGLFAFLLGGSALAVDLDKCMAPSEHTAVTFVLIDRSDEFHSPENFKQSMNAVKKMVAPGERTIVGISTDATSDARLVIDIARPNPSIWVSKLKTRAEEKLFSDCFDSLEKTMLDGQETYKKSAILETLSFVSKVLQKDTSEKKRVVIYSDMIQNSDELSFYKAQTVPVDESLKKVEKSNLLWNFKGVEFQVGGAGVGVTEQKARSIEDFWRKYLERAGGRVTFYGPVLPVAG